MSSLGTEQSITYNDFIHQVITTVDPPPEILQVTPGHLLVRLKKQWRAYKISDQAYFTNQPILTLTKIGVSLITDLLLGVSVQNSPSVSQNNPPWSVSLAAGAKVQSGIGTGGTLAGSGNGPFTGPAAGATIASVTPGTPATYDVWTSFDLGGTITSPDIGNAGLVLNPGASSTTLLFPLARGINGPIRVTLLATDTLGVLTSVGSGAACVYAANISPVQVP